MDDGHFYRVIIGFIIPPTLGCFFFYLVFFFPQISTDDIVGSIQVFLVFTVWTFFIFGIPSLIYSLVMELLVQKAKNDKTVYLISSALGGLSGCIMSYVGLIIGLLVGYIVGFYLRSCYKTANKKINKDT